MTIVMVVVVTLVLFMLMYRARAKSQKKLSKIQYDFDKFNRGFRESPDMQEYTTSVEVDRLWIEKHVQDLLPKLILYTFAHKAALLEGEVEEDLIYSLLDCSHCLNPEQKIVVDNVRVETANMTLGDSGRFLTVRAQCDVSLTLELGQRKIAIANYNTPHRSGFSMDFMRRLEKSGSTFILQNFFVVK